MSAFAPFTCPFCSLHCYDLHLDVDGGHLLRCTPACLRAETGFKTALLSSSPTGASVKGLDPAAALERATGWLEEASQPLVVVSGAVDLAAVRAAIRLARMRSAILDQDDVDSGTGLAAAMRSAGILMGTLGELQKHAGELLLCGVEPGDEMPRIWEVFGKKRKTKAIRVTATDPLVAVRGLRLALREGGKSPEAAWARLAKKTKGASGLVLFGGDWLRAGSALLTELLLWINELNLTGRWYGLPFSGEADRLGVTETFLAETGFPGNVRYAHGEGIFSPDEWQAKWLLPRGAVDVVVFVGNPHGFFQAIVSGRERKQARSILISAQRPDWRPDLWLPVAQPGWDTDGEMLRLDGVPVQLQPVVGGGRSTTTAILNKLMPGELR